MPEPIPLPPLIQVTTSTGWGGRETLPLAIHRGWRTMGGESRLLVRADTLLAENTDRLTGACAVPAGRLALARAVRKELRGLTDAVVLSHYTHDLPALRTGLLGARSRPLAVIKHISPGPSKHDPIHRLLYRRVDLLMAVSEYVRRKCERAYPLDSANTAVWYPGIDPERFRFEFRSRRRCRDLAGVDPAETVIGYVARITPNKGYELLIDAVRRLRRDGALVGLWLVGGVSPDESWYERELHERVAALDLTAAVRFFGARRDVEDFYSAFDLFVTPSTQEAFGLTTIEAMACERPVVGFDAGGTSEIVRHGVTGLLAQPGTDGGEQLAESIRILLDHPERARGMGFEGRGRVMECFTERVMLDSLRRHLLNLN